MLLGKTQREPSGPAAFVCGFMGWNFGTGCVCVLGVACCDEFKHLEDDVFWLLHTERKRRWNASRCQTCVRLTAPRELKGWPTNGRTTSPLFVFTPAASNRFPPHSRIASCAHRCLLWITASFFVKEPRGRGGLNWRLQSCVNPPIVVRNEDGQRVWFPHSEHLLHSSCI